MQGPCASSSSCRHFLRGVVFGALRGQPEVLHAVRLLPREEVHVLGDVLVDEAAPLRRSEEHTSELQSQSNLVCRLLLEKKKKVPASKTPRRSQHTLCSFPTRS